MNKLMKCVPNTYNGFFNCEFNRENLLDLIDIVKKKSFLKLLFYSLNIQI